MAKIERRVTVENFKMLVNNSVPTLRMKYPKIRDIQVTNLAAGEYTRIYITGQDEDGFPIGQLLSIPIFDFEEISNVEEFIEDRLDKEIFGDMNKISYICRKYNTSSCNSCKDPTNDPCTHCIEDKKMMHR